MTADLSLIQYEHLIRFEHNEIYVNFIILQLTMLQQFENYKQLVCVANQGKLYKNINFGLKDISGGICPIDKKYLCRV